MKKLIIILFFVLSFHSHAEQAVEYNMSFELAENGVFVFSLEGTGKAVLETGLTKIPIVKGSRHKRRYVFNITAKNVKLSLSKSLVLSGMDYYKADRIPSEGFELGSAENMDTEKDLVIKDPLKKIMNEIHFLNFRVYNLEKERKLALYVNNMFHSYVPSTGRNKWSGRITSNIYAYLEKNHPADIISFKMMGDGKGTSAVMVSDIEFSRGYKMPDDSEIGYILPNNIQNPNFAVFSLNDYNPDLYLSFHLYNNTSENPVEIEFNNNPVEVFKGRSKKDEWSSLIYLKIPEWMVIRGSNIIMVKNLYNMENNLKKEWGIKKLYQSNEIGKGAYGKFSSEYKKQCFYDRLVYPLKETGNDIIANFRLYNVSGKNSVDVFLNETKIRSFSDITETGGWSDDIELLIRGEDKGRAERENMLVFRRKKEGSDWGVDFSHVLYRSEIEPIKVNYRPEEIPLIIEKKPEKKEKTDPIIDAVYIANKEIEAEVEIEDKQEPSTDQEIMENNEGSLFTFETVPDEAMIFCGGNPHYPGRFIGFTPFSHKIDIPPRTYIYVHIPMYGSNIFFHNPVFEFPMYKYYFNIGKISQFTENPIVTDVFISVPVDYSLVNSAPFICDYDSDGFMDIAVGTSMGDIIVMKKEEAFDYTVLLDILQLEGYTYIVPFFLDYDNDGVQDLIAGTEEGEILLFSMDESGSYLFVKFIAEELMKSNKLSGIAPYIFDLNSDHRKDIIFGTKYGGLFYMLNEGTDEDPEYKSLKRLELPFENPVNLVPAVFFNYRDGLYSVLAGTRDGNLLMLQSPKIIDNELKFDNISILTSQQTMNLGFDLVPRVLDYDNSGSHDILIGNRAGEIILVKYEE